MSLSIPHNNMTHVILTNDLYRLQTELDKAVKKAYVLIHGSVTATKEAVDCTLNYMNITYIYTDVLLYTPI